MEIGNKKIILASASPRRRELLEGMGLQFTVDTKNSFDEVYDESTPKDLIPSVLSKGKSYGFHRELYDDEILITSDTLVLCDDVVMGKPHSYEEAVQMLRMLSGRSHKVITAITIHYTLKKRRFYNDKPTILQEDRNEQKDFSMAFFKRRNIERNRNGVSKKHYRV